MGQLLRPGWRFVAVAAAFAVSVGAGERAAWAISDVGSGASVVGICDESHVRAAVAQGGTITFSCSGDILLSSPLAIVAGQTVTLDATGQTVTLDGNLATQVFVVQGGSLGLVNLTLTRGVVTGVAGVAGQQGTNGISGSGGLGGTIGAMPNGQGAGGTNGTSGGSATSNAGFGGIGTVGASGSAGAAGPAGPAGTPGGNPPCTPASPGNAGTAGNTGLAGTQGTPGNASFPNLDGNIAKQLVLTTKSPPAGKVGVAYSASLAAGGGQAPYHWAIVAGLLPNGLNLSPAGLLSGTPTAASSTCLAIQVKDSAAAPQAANRKFTITISP